MQFHPDHIFFQGKTHRVCEDYADSGVLSEKKLPFAIISDGCTRSVRTDFGSRILTQSAKCHLEERPDLPFTPESTFYQIGTQAKQIIRSLHLPDSSLDATLSLIQVKKRQFVAQSMGDGFFFARDINGFWVIIQRQFSCEVPELGNAPSYLSYWLDAKKSKTYLSIPRFQTISYYQFNPEIGLVQKLQESVYPLDQEKDFLLCMDFPFHIYDILLCASDGFESFCFKGTSDPVPFEEIIPVLLDFKGTTGEFVQSRMQKMVNRDCLRKGWEFFDDLAIAGIKVDL